MANYSRQILSGSVDGKVIPVAATATPGTVLHTAPATTAVIDEPQLLASNVTGAPAVLTIEWGGTGQANWLVRSYVIPANSPPIPIATGGQVVRNGLVVAAFSDVANAINISGGVLRVQ